MFFSGENIYSKFKISGLKLFLDGFFGAKTACMYEPFSDAPDMCGFCVVEEQDIYEKRKLLITKDSKSLFIQLEIKKIELL